jgi:hypothetical protein
MRQLETHTAALKTEERPLICRYTDVRSTAKHYRRYHQVYSGRSRGKNTVGGTVKCLPTTQSDVTTQKAFYSTSEH